MKGMDLHAMLATLIKKTQNNMRLVQELQNTLERDYTFRDNVFDDLETLPRYMNFVVATKTLEESQESSGKMMRVLDELLELMKADLSNYHGKIKLIEYEFHVE